MITLDGSGSSRPLTFRGLSTDTKPTTVHGDLDIRNGDQFLEMDTGNVYFYNKETETWIQPN
jgi:hypothetical protein